MPTMNKEQGQTMVGERLSTMNGVKHSGRLKTKHLLEEVERFE